MPTAQKAGAVAAAVILVLSHEAERCPSIRVCEDGGAAGSIAEPHSASSAEASDVLCNQARAANERGAGDNGVWPIIEHERNLEVGLERRTEDDCGGSACLQTVADGWVCIHALVSQ